MTLLNALDVISTIHLKNEFGVLYASVISKKDSIYNDKNVFSTGNILFFILGKLFQRYFLL
jgi:hypothetical protein